MNGKEILVDTNIFLYLLKGNDTLEEMLQGKNKLADAIIAATAIASNLPLITSDKQFRIARELKLITYEI